MRLLHLPEGQDEGLPADMRRGLLQWSIKSVIIANTCSYVNRSDLLHLDNSSYIPVQSRGYFSWFLTRMNILLGATEKKVNKGCNCFFVVWKV